VAAVIDGAITSSWRSRSARPPARRVPFFARGLKDFRSRRRRRPSCAAGATGFQVPARGRGQASLELGLRNWVGANPATLKGHTVNNAWDRASPGPFHAPRRHSYGPCQRARVGLFDMGAGMVRSVR